MNIKTMLKRKRRKVVALGLVLFIGVVLFGSVGRADGGMGVPSVLTERLVIVTEDYHYVIYPGARFHKFLVAKKQAVAVTQVQVRVSSYYPPAGGPNCADFQHGYCQSAMASGARWEDWLWRQPGAAACIRDWPFGTVFTLPDGSEWVCLDRGGAVNQLTGPPWIDLLEREARYPYGTVVWATIRD